MNTAEINRLVAWLHDDTMTNLDRESNRRLVDALVERLSVYQATETQLAQVIAFNYSNPRRELPEKIGFGSTAEIELATKLLREELFELETSIATADFRGAVDALCDLQYVLLNAVAACGLKEPGLWETLFAEVHKSNMSKFTNGVPEFREDGKLLKGPDYRAPNLEAILLKFGWTQDPKG